jgi:hypothetical protein
VASATADRETVTAGESLLSRAWTAHIRCVLNASLQRFGEFV